MGGPQAGGQSQQWGNLAAQNAQNNPSVAPTNGQYQQTSMNPGAYKQTVMPQGNNMPQAQPAPNVPTPQVQQQPATQPFNINTAAAQGIQASGLGTANSMGYQPQQVQAGQLANTSMTPYMNAYENDVIKANEADILRGANMGMDMLGAQAQAGQAFGGSRHGVALGELGRDTVNQLAQSSANLRQQGYQNAQQMAQQDISGNMQANLANQQAGLAGNQQLMGGAGQMADISNLGFGMGQTLTGNLATQGAQQQAMQQALIDAGKQNFQGYTNQPSTSIGYVTQALGATPVPETQTTSKQPGLFDYLTLGASMSDKRLKKNITKMGQLKSGLNIYKWEWIDGAKELGADMNHTLGVIAQEAKELFPNAVVKMDNGYYAVKYNELR